MERKARKIMIAMDGSEYSDNAYTWYMKYFRRSDDYVIFVHCHEIPQSQLASFLTKKTEDLKDMMIEQEKVTAILIARLNEHLKREQINGKVVRREGDVNEQLLAVADEEHVNCIIAGSRGLNPEQKECLGSVSSFLVHHSKVPVTIVKKHPPKFGNST